MSKIGNIYDFPIDTLSCPQWVQGKALVEVQRAKLPEDLRTLHFKSGLYISRKDRKHMFASTFLSFPSLSWSSHSCNDRRHSYFTRNICSRYVDSFETLFGGSSEACSVIVTTIWRPGFTVPNRGQKSHSSGAFSLVCTCTPFKVK